MLMITLNVKMKTKRNVASSNTKYKYLDQQNVYINSGDYTKFSEYLPTFYTITIHRAYKS